MKTTFVVLVGDSGVDNFLLGRSFLRAYNVLVDMNNRKSLIRDPLAPKHQITDKTFRVITHEPVVLDNPDSLLYQNVLVSPTKGSLKRPHVSGDNMAAVTAVGLLVVPVRNPHGQAAPSALSAQQHFGGHSFANYLQLITCFPGGR